MGLTYLITKIESLTQEGVPYEAQFLVDTSSIDCVVPRDALAKAKIAPEGKADYQLASGQTVNYEYGFSRVSFLGTETVTQVVIGEQTSEPILGVVALENLGYVVDPVSQELKRLDAKPLKYRRRLS